jgi:GTPase SAR1 family protein
MLGKGIVKTSVAAEAATTTEYKDFISILIFHCVLVGNAAVGKKCLFITITRKEFPEDDIPPRQAS